MSKLKTTIGLEIHVQLKTKSKMFCNCDNDSEGKTPNSTVCPVCLGLPGALPVANEQAIIWTIKTGLALNCEIGKFSKFDRKHYFYPDLPKGYQISQLDEPLCLGGFLSVSNHKIRLNRIHLEEDAGKLLHHNSKSLVDLNRAGTPLMEIVTEPDINSVEEAGQFLRLLQKIVRDVASVSYANMEKGNLRCDANISISDEKGNMSEIVELKNINSFRFIEKALAIEENRLKEEYPDWPKNKKKVTRGYDSKKNETFLQRVKEESADYRYFPEPDLPPIDTSIYDLDDLRSQMNETEDVALERLRQQGVGEIEAKYLVQFKDAYQHFGLISAKHNNYSLVAKALTHNYFGFLLKKTDENKATEYAETIKALETGAISKKTFAEIAKLIHEQGLDFQSALKQCGGVQIGDQDNLTQIIKNVLSKNSAEVDRYKNGQKQLIGFFMGQIMKETGGKVNPGTANKILTDLLN